MHHALENGQEPSFQPNFGPILVPQIFFVGFTSTRCCKLLQAITYAILRKTNEPSLRKWQKT